MTIHSGDGDFAKFLHEYQQLGSESTTDDPDPEIRKKQLQEERDILMSKKAAMSEVNLTVLPTKKSINNDDGKGKSDESTKLIQKEAVSEVRCISEIIAATIMPCRAASNGTSTNPIFMPVETDLSHACLAPTLPRLQRDVCESSGINRSMVTLLQWAEVFGSHSGVTTQLLFPIIRLLAIFVRFCRIDFAAYSYNFLSQIYRCLCCTRHFKCNRNGYCRCCYCASCHSRFTVNTCFNQRINLSFI